MLKSITAPITNTLKFIVDAVVGVAGGQKLKNRMMIKYTTATVLIAIPRIPETRNGPQANLFTLVEGTGCVTSSESVTMSPLQRR